MKVLFYWLFALFAFFNFSSCDKKDGLKGPQGEVGEQGLPGVDGNMLRIGNGAPESSLGSEGDFYIDNLNGLLYGPKSYRGWGSGFSLVRSDDLQGLPGNDSSLPSFFSGPSEPNNDVGDIGDFYFHSIDAKLFGPKTLKGWGDGTSLIGPEGPAGNVNIQTSDWIAIPQWAYSVWNDNSKLSVYSFPPSVGNVFNFLNTEGGTMLVYGRNEAHNIVQPFPIVIRNIDNDQDYRMSWAVHSDNKLHLLVSGPYGEQIIKTSLGYEQFRYILIPGGAKVGASLKNTFKEEWKNVDYNQLKQVLNLRD